MFKPRKIEELLLKHKITKKNLCDKSDLSEMGLSNVLNKGTEIGVFKLERIADFFKVPIDYFFDREIELPKHGVSVAGNGNKVQNGNGNVMTEQAKEIDHLKQLLEERERTLQEKERTIQILLKQNS